MVSRPFGQLVIQVMPVSGLTNVNHQGSANEQSIADG